MAPENFIFGYFSYDQALKSMPGYAKVEEDIAALRKQYDAEAKHTADLFSTIFGFPQKELPGSYFCGQDIEVMKTMGRGKMGHIAIMTWSVERAMAYLERNGIELDYDTLRLDAKGKPEFIYLKQDFGGFDLHLAVRRG